MNDAESTDDDRMRATPAPVVHASSALSLKPKGACWYCNAPVDNVRRFCNKTCAEDYQTEEEFQQTSR